MKKTIKFAKFDALLNTDSCDAQTNADLTLTMNLGFRQINPPAGAASGMYNDYGDVNDPARKIIRWTDASWATWKANFITTAQDFWNGKFWLLNDSGCFSYKVLGTTFVPNIYCRMAITANEAGAAGVHHTIDVVRLDPTESWFGSHSTLYDSKDTNSVKKATDSAGKKVMQRAHVHEVGHLLGLGHVDIGKAHCPANGNTNAGACYGVADADMNSVMGSGMKLLIDHAAPWRTAIRSFAVEEVVLGNTMAEALMVPVSAIFFMPTSLLASWPARMRRTYPRTSAEAALGTEITSRIAR